MAHTNENLVRQDAVLQTMREQGAAGIVLCPALGTSRGLPKEVQSWGIPLVVLVRALGAGSYDFAGANTERGVFAATKHLLGAGHKRIAYLGGQAGIMLEQRLKGFKAALGERKLEFDEKLFFGSNPTRQGGYDTMSLLLDNKSRATAAVCYNDIVAFGAMSALGERGLQAGTDFALVGFDNVLDAAHSNPPLTTVDIRPSDLGEQAAALLLGRIQEPERARQIHLTEPKLLLRQSG